MIDLVIKNLVDLGEVETHDALVYDGHCVLKRRYDLIMNFLGEPVEANLGEPSSPTVTLTGMPWAAAEPGKISARMRTSEVSRLLFIILRVPP